MSSSARGPRVVASVICVVVSVMLLAMVAASLVHADAFGAVFLLVAFRSAALVGVAVLALIGVVVVALLRPGRKWLIAMAVVAVFAVAAAVPGLVRAPLQSVSAVPAPQAGQLRVLGWNTNELAVPVAEVSRVIEQTRPDVVVLPEYFTALADGKAQTPGQLHAVSAQLGMQIVGSKDSSATALISTKLGSYHVADAGSTPWSAGVVVESATAGAPKLVLAHLQRPSLKSSATWREHVSWAASECTGADVLAIGDFNAAEANIGGVKLGSCTDAASETGVSEPGTWPTRLPAFLGAAIDHVYAGSAWRAVSFSVLSGEDRAGSDHRPTFTVLTRVG